MKPNMIFLIGFAVGIAGCAEKEQSSTEQANAIPPTVSTVESEATPAQIEDWRTSNFLEHMHAHAVHFDDLNIALDEGDFEGAMTPAYWLSRHESLGSLPADLQPFLVRMREAGRVVEETKDLAAARAGAEQIGKECLGCHTAAGVDKDAAIPGLMND
jgi:hypothetical protein